MPELPEVETVRTGLESTLKGARIRKVTLRRKDLRTPFPKGFAEILEGQGIQRIGRRAKYLKLALSRRKGPIKTVLMDQKLVVGVGNIYASEALFLAGIDPRKPALRAAKNSKKIRQSVLKVLQDAIASGGSSLKDFLHV